MQVNHTSEKVSSGEFYDKVQFLCYEDGSLTLTTQKDVDYTIDCVSGECRDIPNYKKVVVNSGLFSFV
jgi:hypothetical protein